MRKLYLTACAVALCYGFVFAQSTTPNCPQTLRLASSTYEQGRLHEVRGILDGCLKSGGFNDQEKEAAYKLLALSYLYLEEPEQADEAMLNLLRTNPYFEVKTASDPAEFIALYKTFRTRPIYRIGLNVGVNATQPNVISNTSTIEDSKNEFRYKIGFQFAATADVPLSKKLTLNGGIGYQQKSFELTSTVETAATDQQGGDLIVNELIATQVQNWIAIPISVQYLLKEMKYNPYISAGISTDVRLNTEVTAERSREGQTSIEPKAFDYNYQTKLVNVSAIVAAGSKVRVGGGFIVIEAKYAYGLTGITKESTSYQDQEIFLTYGMPNTNIKLNTFSITASYVQNIFNPKKLKSRK